jgi:low affinity Fe/Cu permease
VAVAARNVSTSTADEARASSPFDRIAAGAAGFTSRAPFFVGCVLIVLVWAASFPLFPSTDTWQLVINSATTIVTFLLVALLQTPNGVAKLRCSTSSTRSPTTSRT